MSRMVMLVLMMAVAGVALAASESYTIDPNHTYPNFTINHLGFSTMHRRSIPDFRNVTIISVRLIF